LAVPGLVVIGYKNALAATAGKKITINIKK
jgi:hypothetical protein